MLPALLVRRAKAQDACGISVLYQQLVNNPQVCVLPARIDAIAQDNNTALFVCIVDNQLCATALVSLCSDVMFGIQPFAVIENVVVDSAFRRQGIGAALFKQIEVFCQVNDCYKIMLSSSIERHQAHQFFERLGFIGGRKRSFVKYARYG